MSETTRYFRRYFDMHWSDGYSEAELRARDESIAIESRKRSTLDNIVPILKGITDRLDALEQQARPEQEDGHLAVAPDCTPDPDGSFHGTASFWRSKARSLEQRAETAERERDEWKAEAARAWSEYSRKFDELVTRTTQRDAALAKNRQWAIGNRAALEDA